MQKLKRYKEEHRVFKQDVLYARIKLINYTQNKLVAMKLFEISKLFKLNLLSFFYLNAQSKIGRMLNGVINFLNH